MLKASLTSYPQLSKLKELSDLRRLAAQRSLYVGLFVNEYKKGNDSYFQHRMTLHKNAMTYYARRNVVLSALLITYGYTAETGCSYGSF